MLNYNCISSPFPLFQIWEMGLKIPSFYLWLGLLGEQAPSRSHPRVDSIKQKLFLVFLPPGKWQGFQEPCVRNEGRDQYRFFNYFIPLNGLGIPSHSHFFLLMLWPRKVRKSHPRLHSRAAEARWKSGFSPNPQLFASGFSWNELGWKKVLPVLPYSECLGAVGRAHGGWEQVGSCHGLAGAGLQVKAREGTANWYLPLLQDLCLDK